MLVLVTKVNAVVLGNEKWELIHTLEYNYTYIHKVNSGLSIKQLITNES